MWYHLIVAEGVFNSTAVFQEVEHFYNALGISDYYFEHFPPHIIAGHVHCFIAAKKLAIASGRTENIQLGNEDEVRGTAFYICPNRSDLQTAVEQSIEDKFLGEGYDAEVAVKKENTKNAISIRHFLSQGTAGPDSDTRLHLYFVDRHEFMNSDVEESETDIWKISSGIFLRDKKPLARDRYEAILKKGVKKLSPVVELFDEGEQVIIMISYRKGTTHSYFSSLTHLLNANNLTIVSQFLETFANGLAVCSIYFRGQDKKALENVIQQASILYILPRTGLSSLWQEKKLTLEEISYAFAGWKFAYHFMNRQSEEYNLLYNSLKENEEAKSHLLRLKKRLKGEVETEARIKETISNHWALIKEFYKEFCSFNNPEQKSDLPSTLRRKNPSKVLAETITKFAETDLDAHILGSFLVFNSHILRTNFFKRDKVALSFRLHPSFLKDSDYPIIPYAVYFFLGSDFRGFHIRFTDVARGGIRMVHSKNNVDFQHNVQTIFQENYNLAHTQQKKNKDIPEGGSKGIILLSKGHHAQTNDFIAFKKYIDSMLDLLLPNNEIVDHLIKEEVIFCGPDEGTAKFMDWAALHSKSRGYKFWSAFTTGKSPSFGGIPHDLYGMTTLGVHTFVLSVLETLGIDETKVKKMQTGGPDGDLGSNEIKISHDHTIAIIDGSGVLYDPEGIDREELKRLVNKKSMVKEFQGKFSPQGFRVLVDETNVQLPNGAIVESGLAFRNSFHLSEYARGDLFVPCGGRPDSVDATNVNSMFLRTPEGKRGEPKFRYIVEGANLFFTQEARITLEKAGVVLFKDASANKGGVTSSSFEVLAALSFNDEEFEKHMQVKEDSTPKFYQDYVKEVQEKIQSNARLEFACIWRQSQETGKPKCLLTDELSDKINELSAVLAESEELWSLEDIRRKVLQAACPVTLQNLLTLDTIMKRVPENYLRVLFSSFLASHYVYENGLFGSPEFGFYKFLSRFS
jgi:glutamate dehydrogenase